MFLNAFAFALIAATPSTQFPAPVAPAAPSHSPALLGEAPELAASTLASGRSGDALVTLERASLANPHDPAVLINLGIAYAHAGDEAKARVAFEKALACQEVLELDTADGTTMDSRRLARKAIRMLERGEFRMPGARAGQLTYRD